MIRSATADQPWLTMFTPWDGIVYPGLASLPARVSVDHDFRPYMVKGGIASHSEEHVKFAEDICETMSVDSFDDKLG